MRVSSACGCAAGSYTDHAASTTRRKSVVVLWQVVNNDPSAAVHYKLTITPSFSDISLTPSEQTIINSLWNACADVAKPMHGYSSRTICTVKDTFRSLFCVCLFVALLSGGVFVTGAAKTPLPRQTSPTQPPVMVRSGCPLA